jgi:RNA polymerase sigma-70 factor (ECF subfamily)
MAPSLSDTDLGTVLHEADVAARRLARRLGLPRHQIEDLRQELLVDLLRRMPAYRSCRGTMGAFAGIVFGHKASRIAASVRRERALFGTAPISLDQQLAGSEGLSISDLLPESRGYGTLFGQPTDAFDKCECRLALASGLAVLSHEDLSFCAAVSQATVDELAETGLGPRSSLYRRLGLIRLELSAAGIGAGAM